MNKVEFNRVQEKLVDFFFATAEWQGVPVRDICFYQGIRLDASLFCKKGLTREFHECFDYAVEMHYGAQFLV